MMEYLTCKVPPLCQWLNLHTLSTKKTISHGRTFLMSYLPSTYFRLLWMRERFLYICSRDSHCLVFLNNITKGIWYLPSSLSTMYYQYLQVKCYCSEYFIKGLSPYSFRFSTLKTSTDPDIYTSWFLASSLQDSDNTISVFFAVEKQTGLWTDHYINSFLKGGSYFKRGWRNAKRDLNFNLNLFQQVKGSFERGFQQRWWHLKETST